MLIPQKRSVDILSIRKKQNTQECDLLFMSKEATK